VRDLVGLTIADEPAAWTEIGFAVSRAAFVLGGVTVEVVGRDEGGGSGGAAPLGPGPRCGAV